jgi:preprotein translocase subunit SecF
VSATTTELVPERRHRGPFRRLYYGETQFDFVRRRRWWFAASAIVIAAGVISLATRGLNYSIEFIGGTSWEVPAPGVTVSQAQAALNPYGLGGSTITVLGSGSNQKLNVEAKVGRNGSLPSEAEAVKIAGVLGALVHKPASAVSIEQVGPTWGGEITHKAIEALIVFLVIIALYITIFFEWKMALSAIVAVAHDILVTVGIYSLTFFLVTPDTVVAFLTVLGYSLYDTIVVFDRVRDNSRGLGATGRLSITDVVNLSMNQTLARSINTSLVAILPILAVLVLGAQLLGAVTLEYFGLALLIGLTSGAYSSIFIASPLLAMLKEREPRYRQIRDRLESRGTVVQLLTPAAAAAGALGQESAATTRRGGGRAAKSAPSTTLRPAASRRGSPAAAAPEVIVAEDDVEEPPVAATGSGTTNGAGSGTRPAALSRSGATPGGAQRPRATPNRPPARPRKKRRRR